MPEFDLVIRNGETVTATDRISQDVGISDGRIAALGKGLGSGTQEIGASNRLVMPGGVDAHCHVEQLSAFGLMTSDDFYSASVSAAFGGTTTIIPFAAQHRGNKVRDVVDNYHACAGPKAVIDYGFHLILTDPTENVLTRELPDAIEEGITSFKIYMTYDALKLDDYEILNVLAAARREQALVMVHAENHDVIRWLSEQLLARGHESPKYHAISHPRLAESEATHRIIALGEFMDIPLLIVHVSTAEALDEIRRSHENGLKVFAETCPQYLFLTANDLDADGMEGAKFCCSPPPRDEAAQEAIWSGLIDGSFEIFSSDHAPYRFDDSGKLYAGPKPPFKKIANGVPGLEVRMPLLFSEGVLKDRIDIHRFVALTSTNAARLYGLHPRKGTIEVGSDADLAIWDIDKDVEIKASCLHDNMDYTPYEGRKVKGWPQTVISRGRIVINNNKLMVKRGSGKFLPRSRSDAALPAGRPVPEMDPRRNFNANILGDELL